MKTKYLLAELIIFTISLFCISFVEAEDDFLVKDIKIEGLQKISEGALLNYLPINIGDNIDDVRVKESIRSVYSSGFFKNIESITYQIENFLTNKC